MIKLPKYEKGTSRASTISKLGKVGDKFKNNNFPFRKDFKFQTDNELKN
jgi:hypothetical protein